MFLMFPELRTKDKGRGWRGQFVALIKATQTTVQIGTSGLEYSRALGDENGIGNS